MRLLHMSKVLAWWPWEKHLHMGCPKEVFMHSYRSVQVSAFDMKSRVLARS